jgi:cyclic-di-AMP phosphodiesterase PgpH
LINFVKTIVETLKKIISFIRHSHPEVYKGVLFLIAICTIVYILPKQGKFKYEFQNLKGKPWNHENLVAPFDFAIKKTKLELDAEKAEVIKDTKPYFKIDNTIPIAKKYDFEVDFEKKWSNTSDKNLKQRTLELGNRIIDSIYSKGIIQHTENIESRPEDYSVYILHNNIAEEQELKNFYTIASAYEYVKQQLIFNKKTADDTFLLPLLENAITTKQRLIRYSDKPLKIFLLLVILY